MNFVTLDFETFYDKDFSLTKVTTEEYIRSYKFEAILCGIKINEETPYWVTGTKEEIKKELQKIDWSNAAMLAHNAMFDGAILSFVFDCHPKVLLDTLSMARALHGVEVGGSLKVLAERYNIGVKGTEVGNALGKHRADFSAEELNRYAEYCVNDVNLTHDLFKILAAKFPPKELKVIDLTLKMFTEPSFELDSLMLESHMYSVVSKKEKLMAAIDADKETIMSGEKLAELLRTLGVDPPTKISPKTGKLTYAFAKTDEEFNALLDHSDLRVQSIVAARLGVKSTLEETRTKRFMEIANRGTMPVPLKYYAAHTGRWGGSDKVNLQNLPARGQNANKLKKAMKAPEGYVVIDCDSSQIEARVLAWFSGQEDLTEAFRKKEDVYKIMAGSIYLKPAEDIDSAERFVGKTTILGCISEGTLVLCSTGWKPIETVSLEDTVWDGKEWVCHQGLVKKGIKETLSVCGMWLTPDHKILCGTQWKEAQLVEQDENILSQALEIAVKALPLQAKPEEFEEGQCRKKLMTYDLAYAGPRNRFVVATNRGPVIVHNCGYGMGSAKFHSQLKMATVELELEECKRIINVYRATYAKIPELWNQAQTCIKAMISGSACSLGLDGIVSFDPERKGFKLPNGLWQQYDTLTQGTNAEGYLEYSYKTRKGPVKLYGGKLVENLCQAIARCIIAEQMVMIAKKYRVILTVHDSVGSIAPIAEQKEAQLYIESCMRWVPEWATGLTLDCESGVGESYGDC